MSFNIVDKSTSSKLKKIAGMLPGAFQTFNSNHFKNENNTFQLADQVTSKLVNLDSDGEISGDHVNYDANNTVNDKIDGLETSKADASNVYTKAQVDSKVDETVKTSTVGSDGKTVSFTGIDTSKTYELYADVGSSFSDISPVGIQSMTLNGTTLTYVLTNASSEMSCKLREIKL